jgi:hypothetical protein
VLFIGRSDAQSDFGWLTGVTYAVGTAEEASVSFEHEAFGNGPAMTYS